MLRHTIESAFAGYRSGLVFPETVLQSHWFAVLSAFVAVNTVMYVALAIAKVLPKWYFSDLFSSRKRRSETRSIYPQGSAAGPGDSENDV